MAQPNQPTRYLVKFDRIGRTHSPANLETLARDAEELADRVHRHAKRYLNSRFYDVTVDLESGQVWIDGGRFGKGSVSCTIQIPAGGGRCGEAVPQAGYDTSAGGDPR